MEQRVEHPDGLCVTHIYWLIITEHPVAVLALLSIRTLESSVEQIDERLLET